ncbi:aspartate aminotransferase family protein, partial [Polaribacter sp.]|nr:aspartate aminotransferase family protein [Polaribacter sp.]
KERLLQNTLEVSTHFLRRALNVPKLKTVKGRGLMLGLEFEFPIAELRKNLIYKHKIFTGSAKNPNVLRILPPLTIKKSHIDTFFEALISELS